MCNIENVILHLLIKCFLCCIDVISLVYKENTKAQIALVYPYEFYLSN